MATIVDRIKTFFLPAGFLDRADFTATVTALLQRDISGRGARSYAQVMKRSHLAHALVLSLITLGFAACSSDMDDADRRPRNYPGDGDRRGGMARANPGAGDGLEMMPPADWWHDPQISVSVNLTGDQTASLDRISREQSEEIAKLERDSMVAARDLRQVVDSATPASADITSAGQRLRGIRDALFDRRVQLFAAERTLLTQQQWEALQAAVNASRNQQDRGNRDGYGRRGRGGMGGRGRFPGSF
jgi:Spy/CpxP family protein refolding chaperone